jgi:hypothetical protein
MQMECAERPDETKENISRDGQIYRIPWAAAALLALAMPTGAQQLRLSQSAGKPGGTAEMTLSIRSPAGQQPAGLQWTISVPGARLKIGDEFASLSAAAKNAGKAVHCAVGGAANSALTARCILAGGREPLPDGPAVTFRFTVAADAKRGNVEVRIREVSAVSADSKLKRLPQSTGRVSVRNK